MAEQTLKQVKAEMPMQQMVTFRLSRLHAKLNAQAVRILKETAGISLSQWRIMVMIETFGKITPAEFVRRTGFDKGLISRTVKRMIKEGLLSSDLSKSDQRSHMIDITEKGTALFEKARPHMRHRQAHLLNSLTVSERKVLFTAFDKLELAMDDLEPLP
ncbi:MAG: MarR family transcriptional regulator [Rhodobacteraceae bacterium]|nr:MarR family transcriptional regulator [Paracoccaceae bacterium]